MDSSTSCSTCSTLQSSDASYDAPACVQWCSWCMVLGCPTPTEVWRLSTSGVWHPGMLYPSSHPEYLRHDDAGGLYGRDPLAGHRPSYALRAVALVHWCVLLLVSIATTVPSLVGVSVRSANALHGIIVCCTMYLSTIHSSRVVDAYWTS